MPPICLIFIIFFKKVTITITLVSTLKGKKPDIVLHNQCHISLKIRICFSEWIESFLWSEKIKITAI